MMDFFTFRNIFLIDGAYVPGSRVEFPHIFEKIYYRVIVLILS
jgi:hypothetical protein